MTDWLIKSKESLLDQVLDFLWRQWCELGVAGTVRSKGKRIIDPESLLLFSLNICRYEARLFDEIIDWLFKNGHLINVQRLRQIQDKYNFDSGPQLSAIAALLSNQSKYRLKWAGLGEKYYREPSEPLFLNKDGAPLPCPKDKAANPQFAAHGLLRGRINLRGLSQPFDSESPGCLLLRLRALIGVNARAEILCLLASINEIHPSEMARQTGFYQKTTQTVLAEMARSGVILVRSSKKEKLYRLKADVLDPLLKPGGQAPAWVNWANLFKSVEIVWQRISELSKISLDPLLLASELNKLIKYVREYCADPDIDKIKTGYGTKEDEVAEQFRKTLKTLVRLLMPAEPGG